MARALMTATAAVAGLLAVACRSDELPPADPQSVDPPPLVLVDSSGTSVHPLESSADASVFVFVTTTCPLSNRYAPTIRGLFGTWAGQGIAAWLVYPDPDDDTMAIAEHQREFGLALPTLRDPEHQLVARAQARVTPEAAVFARGAGRPSYRGRIDDRVAELGKMRAEAGTHDLADAVEAVRRGHEPDEATRPAIGCYISDLR